MSHLLFIKKALLKRGEVGAILPSSSFLAKIMVHERSLENTDVIVELGAGTGSFTDRLFRLDPKYQKKFFIIEKDYEMYLKLIHRFPERRSSIYHAGVNDLFRILEDSGITQVDFVVSGLPFRSLPESVFIDVLEKFGKQFFHEQTKFVQFSYFHASASRYHPYFTDIKVQRCLFNIPPASVYSCEGYRFIKKKSG